MNTDERALNDLFVGRSIVSGSNAVGEMLLDNGQKLTFEGYGECCAYADVTDLARETHVITSVQTDHDTGGLRVFALVQGRDESTLFRVVGSEGSGYYTYGVELFLDGVSVLDMRRPFDG